jgi:hypothetical protein
VTSTSGATHFPPNRHSDRDVHASRETERRHYGGEHHAFSLIDRLGERVEHELEVAFDVRDPVLSERLVPVLNVALRYFDAAVEGFDNLPPSGPFLVVGKHNRLRRGSVDHRRVESSAYADAGVYRTFHGHADASVIGAVASVNEVAFPTRVVRAERGGHRREVRTRQCRSFGTGVYVLPERIGVGGAITPFRGALLCHGPIELSA